MTALLHDQAVPHQPVSQKERGILPITPIVPEDPLNATAAQAQKCSPPSDRISDAHFFACCSTAGWPDTLGRRALVAEYFVFTAHLQPQPEARRLLLLLSLSSAFIIANSMVAAD